MSGLKTEKGHKKSQNGDIKLPVSVLARMARFVPLAARPGKQRMSAVLFAFRLFSRHSAARKLLAPARTSTLKSRQYLKAKPKRREGQNPSRRFGADGEI